MKFWSRAITIILVLALTTIFGRFCLGVYVHDEFCDKSFFVKHKPNWKWYFYSPIGMSDQTLDDLDPERKKEQVMFNEYIKNQGLSQ